MQKLPIASHMRNVLKQLIALCLIFLVTGMQPNKSRHYDAITSATVKSNGNSIYHQSQAFELQSGSLQIVGEVEKPGTVDLSALYLHEVVVKESEMKGDSVVFIGAYRYTGYSLLDILNPYILKKKNAELFRPVIDAYVEIENADGEKVVFSWSEIFHVNQLHQILIATGGSQVNPHKKQVEYPRAEKWKVVAAGDLRNSRQLINPVRITVRSFDRKDYIITRNLKPLFSPEVRLCADATETKLMSWPTVGQLKHYETLFYGMGMGYHPSESFSGLPLDDLVSDAYQLNSKELQRTGLVCFAGLDGYRSLFSFSELFNRVDQVPAVVTRTGPGIEGGMYRIFHPSDFFADRSVKALQEIYVFQPE